MKKIILLFLVISFFSGNMITAQRGFLKKVAKSVTNNVIGKEVIKSDENIEPEPSCACDDATLLFDFNGDISLNYNEIFVFYLPDGRLLVRNYNEYYIASSGDLEGPYEENNAEVKEFMTMVRDYLDPGDLDSQTKKLISETDGKFMITFKGKKYGSFSRILQLRLSLSGENFAAIVSEANNMPDNDMTDIQAAILNAKSNEERTKITMDYAQKMQQMVMGSDANSANAPKLVTNLGGAHYDFPNLNDAKLYAGIKYDGIVILGGDKLFDLKGNVIWEVESNTYRSVYRNLFLTDGNELIAERNDDGLSLSNGTLLEGAFMPWFRKVDGRIYLSYNYYSPETNGVMECLIPF